MTDSINSMEPLTFNVIRSADGSMVIDFDQQRLVIDETRHIWQPPETSVEMFPEPPHESDGDLWDDPYYGEEEAQGFDE